MEIKNFTITKRDGSKDQFSLDKIMNAIVKAFESVNEPADLGIVSKILNHLDMHDDITVEEIQNQVEEALMREGYYNVAKSFILYRQLHSEDRDTLEKMMFLSEYTESVNAATGSKYDANANVEHKNIATLIGELPKSNFIRLNRRLLTDRIKKMYGKALADEYIDKLTHHFIYKNDETSLANYCASITMYPWLINGTTEIGGNSTAPTNLKSFAGGFVNMVFMVSSMLSGACATPEFLMYMNYFIGKEYGLDYWKRANEQADLSLKKRTIDKVITDYFEQIVYTLNQPTGARNYQAVFWNVAYYDRYYFESIFGEFYFPDGSKPDWEGLSWLQKRFMKWFNKERTKTMLTFPVETNRCIQYAVNHKMDYLEYLSGIIDLCHKVQLAYNENLKELQSRGMLPLFDAGYINIGRQYLTIGINGLVEAAEFMGLKITPNDDYLHFVQGILGLIEKYNKKYRTKDVMFNCEMIPAENVGVKHAKWDREDGYFVPRDCYNSYFYVVEDDSLTIIDKFKLHGAPYIEHLTGGSALHMNLEEHLSKEQYAQLLKVAAKEGCNYFTFNIPNTVCNECGHIDKRYLHECPNCHSKNVDYMTRIIGYLKRVSNFSQARQEEASRRYYAHAN